MKKKRKDAIIENWNISEFEKKKHIIYQGQLISLITYALNESKEKGLPIKPSTPAL